MQKILTKQKQTNPKANTHAHGNLKPKHNVGKSVLASLEAIKEGNVIIIEKDELKEGIKKLLD
ncbi:MAG: hypothetical protein ACHQM6_03125 [Candidatus Kapaibacterium sp.]